MSTSEVSTRVSISYVVQKDGTYLPIVETVTVDPATGEILEQEVFRYAHSFNATTDAEEVCKWIGGLISGDKTADDMPSVAKLKMDATLEGTDLLTIEDSDLLPDDSDIIH